MKSISFLRNKRKSKLGVSIMIGYVLLVAFAVVIGAIVYNWMKSYVPTEKPECPEGVSLIIKEISCNESNLTINVKNNGRFELTGYFIRAANSTSQKIATIDLSPYADGIGGMIKFGGADNSLEPSGGINEDTRIFMLSKTPKINVTSIEIIPIRYEVINNKKVMEVCNNAKIKEEITCPSP